MTTRTVLVLGDQLSRTTGALVDATPGDARVVMIESWAKLRQRPWHRQKLAYVLSAMRHFAAQLRAEGFEVSYHAAATIGAGLAEAGVDPGQVTVMAPSSWDFRQVLDRWGATQVPNDAYIAGEEWFAKWAGSRKGLLLEGFYRQIRREHGWLMDGTDPAGGKWNLDADNREPPPKKGTVAAPEPYLPVEDDLDARVRRDVTDLEQRLGLELYGEDSARLFPATRAEALAALERFLATRLAGFGPLEDAVVADEPFLWHSLLSAPLNLGLLHPAEVCDAVDRQYRATGGPLNSYEGFLRQVCGWREYVWGLYWYRMPRWRDDNALGQDGRVPPFYWDAQTDMHCVASVVKDLLARAWTHHIPRLMVLGNFALIAGVNPQALTEWFHSMYIDGYDWVMAPNVVGMSQWADGGVMATKPYAASARYLNRMTDYCGDCAYNPNTRTDEDSCPFNALYWDFLARNRATLAPVRRMSMVTRQLDRFGEDERRRITDRARRYRAAPVGG